MRFDKAQARQLISSLSLRPANAAIAELWLSLWDGDALPKKSAVTPAQLKKFLPNLLLFDVVPETSVTVRLAGTFFTRILGMELTGLDWIEAAPADYRAERLSSFTEIALGALYRGSRDVEMTFGPNVKCQEILLPLAPDSEGAAYTVLCHIDCPRTDRTNRVKPHARVLGGPLDVALVRLEPAITLARAG
jgi:hypothetical protein